jgi:hypothetical protein
MQIKKGYRSKQKIIIWAIAGLALLCIAFVAYYFLIRNDTEASDIRPVNTVDYSSPSEKELKETEAFKQKQQTQDEQTGSPSPNVTPVISYVGQYDAAIEASAFVSSIIEDGGTCTLTLAKGSLEITKSVPARKDAQTTKCDFFTFPAKELAQKGAWSATVSYKSATSSGTSAVTKFEVK